MDDFEQLGVTAIAEFPPKARPAQNLGEVATVLAAGIVLTAVAIFACVAIAAEVALVLNGSAGIQ